MRSIFPIAALSLVIAVAQGLPGCNSNMSGVLVAKKVTNRGDLIGGPEAVADVGDFLLENDQIRVMILGTEDSAGPGVYGGSLADADIRRDYLGFEDANGHDEFAELFPVANLVGPDPGTMGVSVLKDGSDGQEASIRVVGTASYLFQALSILDQRKDELSLIFPGVKTKFSFQTDYIVHLGDHHVTITTTLTSQELTTVECPTAATCEPSKMCMPTSCNASACPNGFATDANGCLTCECGGAPVPLTPITKSVSVFGGIFGDAVSGGTTPAVNSAGVIAGDFVFYSGHTNMFAPGIGFDTDSAINHAFYSNRNTFQQPLTYSYVAGAAGDVSYAYFTKAANAGDADPVLNVPIFSSSATAFLDAQNICNIADGACQHQRAWTYTRYFAIGAGDIGSVEDEIFKVRGTPTGTIQGVVLGETGDPSPRAHVYLFRDPDPSATFASVDQLALANIAASTTATTVGDQGVVDMIDADPGLSLTPDGSYQGTTPPGDYILVARRQDGQGASVPARVHVTAGQTAVFNPVVPTPATIEYHVTDETGQATPAKITVVGIGSDGLPLEGDGNRRVYLGDGRLGNGVRTIEYAGNGDGTFTVEPGSVDNPGRYRIRASRGPEYSIYEEDVEVAPAQVIRFDALIAHEVDTTGWMSTDMHIHAQASHDSGMLLPDRVATVVDEDVELAVATDHDVETDYGPTVKSLYLQPFVTTAVAAETTTIEQGHFIGFPQTYDYQRVPTHGAHDPTCQGGGDILNGLRANAVPGHDMFTIVAHPNDGFFGYIYQLGVDTFAMTRTPPLLEAQNPVFRTASCDFDGMEVINGKRFDLDRTPTVEEVVDYNLCRQRLDTATEFSQLATFCPELGTGQLAPCKQGEAFAVCQTRNRTELAWEMQKKILTRTPEEQAANWAFPLGDFDTQNLCSCAGGAPCVHGVPASYATSGVPRDLAEQPCTIRSGQIDDYFRYVEHGMLKTQVSSSDTHNGIIEPGSPRTYFQSPTDDPEALTVDDAVASLKAGHALATYGPFVTGTINGKSWGDTAAATGGGKVTLNLKVQTASWFGVDRIEVYEDGQLVNVTLPTSKPTDIIDFEGPISLDVPKGRDSWVVVVALGLETQNLMSPVYLDVPYGEIQISVVTAQAFALVPVVNSIFPPIPIVPDWSPIPAYAVTNPIYLDTDGNGKYDAPLPYPEFCSKPCNPNVFIEGQCPAGQICLTPEAVCGIDIGGTCDFRRPWATYTP